MLFLGLTSQILGFSILCLNAPGQTKNSLSRPLAVMTYDLLLPFGHKKLLAISASSLPFSSCSSLSKRSVTVSDPGQSLAHHSFLGVDTRPYLHLRQAPLSLPVHRKSQSFS